MFTLAETASGAAMAGGFAELILGLRPVAKESRIQYQKVAQGATRAEGRVPGDLAALKAQLKRRTARWRFPVEVDIFDADGTLAAQVTGRLVFVRRSDRPDIPDIRQNTNFVQHL